MKARVLVVDDQALYRAAICRSVDESPSLQVVGRAASGREALARIAELKPDLVSLDLEMPDLDGVGVLQELQRLPPPRPKVIVFSAHSAQGAAATIQALALGAADFVLKPNSTEGAMAITERLVPRLVALAPPGSSPALPPAVAAARAPVARQPLDLFTARRRIVVIASSTGGPNALDAAMRRIPADLPVPVIIVQHMPALFTASLADRLDKLGRLRVAEARDGEILQPGRAYLAPGDYHVVVAHAPAGPTLRINQGERIFNLRPAADATFPTVADAFGGAVVAAVFTGMGCDGTAGCQKLAAAGAAVLTQSASSCVVYGMPEAVDRAGLAHLHFTPEDFAEALGRFNLRW